MENLPSAEKILQNKERTSSSSNGKGNSPNSGVVIGGIKGESKNVIPVENNDGAKSPSRPSYRRYSKTKIKITTPIANKSPHLVYFKNHRTVIIMITVLSFVVLTGFASAGVYYWVQQEKSTETTAPWKQPFFTFATSLENGDDAEQQRIEEDQTYDPPDIVYGALPWMADQCVQSLEVSFKINRSCIYTIGYGVDPECQISTCRLVKLKFSNVSNKWNLPIFSIDKHDNSVCLPIANYTPCNWNHWCIITANGSSCSFIQGGDPRVELWDIPGKWEDSCEPSSCFDLGAFENEGSRKLKNYSLCNADDAYSMCNGTNEIVPKIIFLRCVKHSTRGRFCDGLPFRMTTCVKCSKFLDFNGLHEHKKQWCKNDEYKDYKLSNGCVFSCISNQERGAVLVDGTRCNYTDPFDGTNSIGYCLMGICYKLTTAKSKCD